MWAHSGGHTARGWVSRKPREPRRKTANVGCQLGARDAQRAPAPVGTPGKQRTDLSREPGRDCPRAAGLEVRLLLGAAPGEPGGGSPPIRRARDRGNEHGACLPSPQKRVISQERRDGNGNHSQRGMSVRPQAWLRFSQEAGWLGRQAVPGTGGRGVGEGPLRIAQEGGVRFTLGRREGGSERRPEEPCVQLGLDNRSCGGCSFIVCIR